MAYREFARGHDWRLQRPVTLYSLRQKFFSFVVLALLDYEGMRTLLDVLELEGAELLVDNLPDDFVGRHVDF